jgi:hypothetical protein
MSQMMNAVVLGSHRTVEVDASPDFDRDRSCSSNMSFPEDVAPPAQPVSARLRTRTA